MSLKSIDMSLAVHKSADAGQAQRDLQHKPVVDQTAMAASSVKSAETERQRPAKLDESDKSRIRKHRNGRDGAKGRADASPDKEPGEVQEQSVHSKEPGHPFKGHHIDLSL
ncbi:MAG: hypothetical protein K0R57_3610 [Paenibacillaceae bacterium]|jgi:hypothetical protein|nr:hypothetical protein [Paenibacillaceae bacterium]